MLPVFNWKPTPLKEIGEGAANWMRTSLRILGADKPYQLIIEPWATSFTIIPGDKAEIVGLHPEKAVSFALENSNEHGLIVYLDTDGCVYEFWRNGILED